MAIVSVDARDAAEDGTTGRQQARDVPSGELPERRGGRDAAAAVAGAAGASSVPEHWHRVAPELSFVDKPRWSPDGRLLYFIARGAGSRFNVWAVRIAPAKGMPIGAPMQVTRFDRPDLIISPDVDQAEMSLSADRLVLTMKQMSGSVWVLDGVGGAAGR